MKPLVSVIMPVYNCKEYIASAVDSIINQSYRNLEIIIVDDASSDGTWEILQEYANKDKRVRVYKNEVNLKIVGTLNRAIDLSTGIYLARMDGDDEKILDAIEKQVDFMESNLDVAVVGGAVEICDSEMRRTNTRHYATSDKEIRSKLFRFSPYAHGSILMRKSMVPSEPYKLNWAEDYDLYFRLGKAGKFANLTDIVYRLRTHAESVSRTKARYQEGLTLYIRIKAVYEYGYQMTGSDKVYFFGQMISQYIMPTGFRFWLFNKVRKYL